MRSCPRCGRRNGGAVVRFFGMAAMWCLGALAISAAIAHQSDWRTDITMFVAAVTLLIVAAVSFARTAKWRSVRARVVFVTPKPHRTTSKSTLTPQS